MRGISGQRPSAGGPEVDWHLPGLQPRTTNDQPHDLLGLGELPTGPVVVYLARSVSAFYAFFGALCLVLAADLERYRPLVRFLGVSFTGMGMVFIGVDLVAGMPWWWSACEGPPGIVMGAVVLVPGSPGSDGHFR